MTVGQVVRAHGVRGEVAVEVLSDAPRRFARGAEVEAVGPRGERRALVVERFSPGAKGARVKFAGIEDRDAAEALRGQRLEVPRERVGAPPAGSHWYFELVGCRCETAAGERLGEVSDVVESGGGHLLHIDRGDGSAVLVPYVESYLAEVDVAARRIVVRLPEGFVETCAFRY